MTALLDTIIKHVPPPKNDDRPEFAMSVVMLSRDDFVGRLCTGRVASGVGKVGDPIIALNLKGEKTDSGKVSWAPLAYVSKAIVREGDGER